MSDPVTLVSTAPEHTYAAYHPDTMPGIVTWAAECVRRSNVEAIVACGHSGLSIGGAVSYLTRVPLLAVRKANEVTVARTLTRVTGVLPNGPAARWAWLDDVVCTGSTLIRAASSVFAEGLVTDAIPTSLVLYAQHGYPQGAPDDLTDLYERMWSSWRVTEAPCMRYCMREFER